MKPVDISWAMRQRSGIRQEQRENWPYVYLPYWRAYGCYRDVLPANRVFEYVRLVRVNPRKEPILSCLP